MKKSSSIRLSKGCSAVTPVRIHLPTFTIERNESEVELKHREEHQVSRNSAGDRENTKREDSSSSHNSLTGWKVSDSWRLQLELAISEVLCKKKEAEEARQWAELALHQVQREAEIADEEVQIKEKEAEEARLRANEIAEQKRIKEQEAEEARKRVKDITEQARRRERDARIANLKAGLILENAIIK